MVARRWSWVVAPVAVLVALAGFAPVHAFATSWPTGVARVAMDAVRVSGGDTFGDAAAAAKRAYPGWDGVTDVVIASGEESGLRDAAAASSLCWAYDAPLLLTARGSLPQATRDALADIAAANTTVTVHVVGSSVSVPAARIAQIVSAIGTDTVEQPWPSADTYTLAASIASRVRSVAASTGATVPTAAIVVEGSASAHVWDAAAASAVSRESGAQLLYVRGSSVPFATKQALLAAGSPSVIIVGGTQAVSSAVFGQLRASERWWGMSRGATAVSVARHSVARGWGSPSHVAFAVTAPDAIVAGSLAGARGGVMLLTDTVRLSHDSWTYLAEKSSELSTGYAVGGRRIAQVQIDELRGGPARPWLANDAPGRYVGKATRVTGWTGGNTTTVAVYVRGKKVRSIDVKPWSRFNFPSIAMPKTGTNVTAEASNPDGGAASTTRAVKRLKYPYATCIVIDKSDFKLYWIRGNRLVKAYPIAVGRLGMETPPARWKILAKYHTDPGSVYGPRKMRLFRQRGNRYVFSRYGIHGTNQEWVIGTKASHGCIRMYNRDVLELFPQVKIGTMVVTRN